MSLTATNLVRLGRAELEKILCAFSLSYQVEGIFAVLENRPIWIVPADGGIDLKPAR